jgi:hypothetical protein
MVVAQVIEGLEVARCEVEDVDVIADGCAVMGGIVWNKDNYIYQ